MSVELFRNLCGAASTILAIASGIPYIRGVLQGKTKPHQFSFLVFAIMNGLVFITQFLEGARQSVLIALVFFIYTIIIFILSLFKGTRNTSSLDKGLFGLALFITLIWLLTQNNVLAIWLTVAIDICATSMILLKIKDEPKSEDPIPWLISTRAYIFTCLSLAGRSFSIIYLRPFYGLFSAGIVVWYVRHLHKKSRSLAHETSSLMQ
jgi:uncharacterized membrane protein